MRAGRTLLCAAAALLVATPPAGAAEVVDRPDLVLELPGTPVRRPARPGLPRRVRGAGPAAVPLRRRDREPGRDARPLRGRGNGVRAGGLGRAASRRRRRRPDELPAGPDAEIVDRSVAGAGFEYAVEKTHEHFHFASAARYELQPRRRGHEGVRQGRLLPVRLDPAASTSSTATRARSTRRGARSATPRRPPSGWGCRPAAPTATAPSASSSGSTSPGLDPGPATLRGEANPLLCVLERDTDQQRDGELARRARCAGRPGRGGDCARHRGDRAPVAARWWRRRCPRAAAAAARPSPARPPASSTRRRPRRCASRSSTRPTTERWR